MNAEKMKMLSGLPYEAWDKELFQDREKAKDITFTFNALHPSLRVERCDVLRQLVDAQGSFHVESPFQCDYGYNIHLGDNFYANHNCIMLDEAAITIGKNVLLGPNVSLYTAGHPIHPKTRATGMEYALPITIGDDVWIGGNSVVNPGVRIGEGSIIGSGSVVNKDIPDHVIAVGNPIRIIRKITEADRNTYYKNQSFE